MRSLCYSMQRRQIMAGGRVQLYKASLQHHNILPQYLFSGALRLDVISRMALGKSYANIKMGECQSVEVGIPRLTVSACRLPQVSPACNAEPPLLKELKSNN